MTPSSSPKTAVLGAGFIGLNYVRYALNLGDSVRVLDHKPAPPNLAGHVDWVKGDLGDAAALAKTLDGVETVLHFISSTVVGDEVDIAEELRQNVFQTLQLLEMCVQRKIRRVIFLSSASVYGVQKTFPISESASTDPISAHGIHKLTIEKYLQLYRHQHGLDCKILRLSNPYGPGQKLTGRQGLVAIAIGRMMAGEKVSVRGDGHDVRDFIYVDDVCRAIRLATTTDSQESIFNVGSGTGTSIKDVIELIGHLAHRPVQIEYSPSRYVDIPKSVLDISRARSLMNFTDLLSLSEGIARTLSFHGALPEPGKQLRP